MEGKLPASETTTFIELVVLLKQWTRQTNKKKEAKLL